MCLAIYKPAGKVIPDRYLEEGFRGNPHGAGMAFAENGILTIKKGYFNINKFIEDYTASCHLPMLIHFRFATHGKQNQHNCHPFPMLDNKAAVIHNGIINIQSTDDLSDTGHFVKLVMEPVAKAMPIDHPSVKYLIEQSIGASNKIAVLHADGTHAIFNEDSGHWNDGVWYSNHGYVCGAGFGYSSMHGRWMDDEFETNGASKRYLTDPASEREERIRQIMRIESCSRLDAEWFEESGWPWDQDLDSISEF